MTVCKFYERTLPEHEPRERKWRRIDEHFVEDGGFIRFDPMDTSPRFVDPPHKRTEKNRRARRAEYASQRVVFDEENDESIIVPRGRTKPTMSQRAPQTRKDRKVRRRARRRQQAHMRTGS